MQEGIDIIALLKLAATVCGIVFAVVAYVKALQKAKAGILIVYCGWRDCLMSSAWMVLVPLGICWLLDSSAGQLLRIGGFASIGFGLCSIALLIIGAFKYNRGNIAWLSLFGRFAVSLLLFLAIGKLNETLQEFRRGRYGKGSVAIVQGLLFPTILFFAVFRLMIRPMVGSGELSRRPSGVCGLRVNQKGSVMKKNQKLTKFLQYLKEQLPIGCGSSAEEYYSQGLKYYKGSDVKRDLHLAFICFEHAAKKGLLDAQYRLGMAYDSGDGVTKDKYLAFKWYMKAAERGHAAAQMCIGYAYRNGEGCTEDVHKAYAWYLKAAEQDDETAQNNLAMMYECGVGVAKDIEKARYWYKKAIENGNVTAGDNLKDMETKLVKAGKSNNNVGEKRNDLIDVPVSEGAATDVDLKSLVGLEPVKKAVSELRNFIAYQIECGKRGLPSVKVSNHCVFTGNPGTGKTTVARIVAKLYHEMGILATAKVVEVDRSKVVGEYIGHTAKQMSKVIDEAMDGVLFIDEAYSLAEGGEKDYGREAVEVLLKRMDDNRDRLVVIVAGYTDEMHKFIDMNPGLKSRFTHYIEFPDYSAEELERIFLSMCEKDKYICNDEVRKAVRVKMDAAIEKRDRSFGNARFVRNFYEEAQRRIASRLANKLSSLTDEELKTFAASDFA